MRYVIACLIVLPGCVTTLPIDHELTADLACETARLVVQLRAPAPQQDAEAEP